MTFELKVITPIANESYLVKWVEIETPRGSLVIQKGHEPLITSLKVSSDISFETDESVIEHRTVNNGIIYVDRLVVMLIIGQ